MTKAELEMPGDRKLEITPDNQIYQLRIEMPPEEQLKPHIVVVRCLDRVGLPGYHERKFDALPNLPAGQMIRDPKLQPKNGVIEGVLILPKAKKPAEGFTVSLDEVPNSETKTKSDGHFRFSNLDRTAEYTLVVGSRSLNSTSYGLSSARKLQGERSRRFGSQASDNHFGRVDQKETVSG